MRDLKTLSVQVRHHAKLGRMRFFGAHMQSQALVIFEICTKKYIYKDGSI